MTKAEKPRGAVKIKLKCLHCDCENFESKNIRFNPEIKGEEVKVVVPSFVCAKCNIPLMDSAQMNFFRKAAADKYRKSHHR